MEDGLNSKMFDSWKTKNIFNPYNINISTLKLHKPSKILKPHPKIEIKSLVKCE